MYEIGSMITRTEILPGKAPFIIEQGNSIITIGSCFADMIGTRLQHYRFNVLANPFGTTFNPISIFQLLNMSLNKKYDPLPASSGEIWYDHQFHSELSAFSPERLQDICMEQILQVHKQVHHASVLVITLGTAWVYRHMESNTIVSNCHKQPGRLFTKELISVKHILEDFEPLYAGLKAVNQGLKIIFTVSPVRHIKDSLPLNSVSKSILISAAYYICEAFDDCYYFPAYELQIDDLRDYRYYAEDMLHPSTQAEDYIWNKLSNWAFSTSLQDAMAEWDHLQRLLQHKAFHPDSMAHQQFLTQTIQRFEQFHYWDVSDEITTLKTNLLQR